MEQRTEEWHDARRGKMTCSRMAEAIGMIGSRRRLWRELTGREGRVDTNERMQTGIDCEPLALATYEVVMGAALEKVGFVAHPTIDWIGGSPDGLSMFYLYNQQAILYGGVETKCPAQPYETPGFIPEYYLPQMQGLMEVTDRKWWDFVVWTPDSFTVTRVDRSPMYWERLYELLCEFWTYVDADVEPPKFARGSKPKIDIAVNTRLLHKE